MMAMSCGGVPPAVKFFTRLVVSLANDVAHRESVFSGRGAE